VKTNQPLCQGKPLLEKLTLIISFQSIGTEIKGGATQFLGHLKMFLSTLSAQHFIMEFNAIKVQKHTKMIKEKLGYLESNKMH
jgi:hypothetical protein